MTIDERLEAVARSLDTLTQIHLDNDREYRDRFERLASAQEKNSRDIQALTVRMDALTRDVETLSALARQDGENIRALARIAEMHEHRLDRLES